MLWGTLQWTVLCWRLDRIAVDKGRKNTETDVLVTLTPWLYRCTSDTDTMVVLVYQWHCHYGCVGVPVTLPSWLCVDTAIMVVCRNCHYGCDGVPVTLPSWLCVDTAIMVVLVYKWRCHHGCVGALVTLPSWLCWRTSDTDIMVVLVYQ